MMTAHKALNMFCHTSYRTSFGEIYTIADSRADEYNGLKIKAELNYGRYVLSWVSPLDNIVEEDQ